MTNLERQDENYYVCIAENDVSMVRDFTYLYVLPKGNEIEIDNNIRTETETLKTTENDETDETVTDQTETEDLDENSIKTTIVEIFLPESTTVNEVETETEYLDDNYIKNPTVEIFGPESIYVNEGETVEIKCNISGSDNAELRKDELSKKTPKVEKLGSIHKFM